MDNAVSIDSSIFIEHFRAKDKTKTKLFYCTKRYRLFYVSAVVKYEVLCGIKETDKEYWQDLFDSCIILPFDDETVETARQIYRQLKQDSCLVAMGDILIAATAVRYGVPLLTANRKHFDRMDGLKIV